MVEAGTCWPQGTCLEKLTIVGEENVWGHEVVYETGVENALVEFAHSAIV